MNDNELLKKKAAEEDPGVAYDIADNEKESESMVDDMTRNLNNNHAGDNDYQGDN